MNSTDDARPLWPRQLLPPLAALRAFVAVGQEGGIRRAAQGLGVDHTAISRHLRQLEAMLGMPLFARGRTGVVLTEAGARYHRRVAAVLMELGAATAEAADTGPQLAVRLWCIPGLASQWLAERVADFERRNPAITVELRPTDAAPDLVMLEADADVRYYGDEWTRPPGGDGLRFVELARPPVFPVANPAVLTGLGQRPTVEALLRSPLIHEEDDRQWRAWLGRNDVTVTAPLPGPLMWHAHLALAAARQGRGIALANRLLVAADLRDGRLIELAIPGTRPVNLGAYCFTTRGDRWTRPAIARLRRFLVACVSEP